MNYALNYSILHFEAKLHEQNISELTHKKRAKLVHARGRQQYMRKK